MHKTSWRQQVLRMGLGGLLSLSGCWLVASTIAPPPVQAYVSRSSVVLDVQVGESYAAFLSRAEAAARTSVQRNFDRDILISEAYVVIVGQRQGQTTPVLSVRVSRNQWRARPDSRRWATYFPSARVLLGFGIPATTPAGRTPTPSPTPTTITPTTTPSPSPTRNRPAEPEQSPLEQLLPQPEPTPATPAPTQTPNSTPLPPGSTR